MTFQQENYFNDSKKDQYYLIILPEKSKMKKIF